MESPLDAAQAAEIRAYLDKLLASPHFPQASRRGQLLEYLVARTLEGNGDRISEYSIGLDVFEKPPAFDTRIDSVVRTEVSRLRQRLKDYYAAEGQGDRLTIEFSPRSYAPSFVFRQPDPAAEPEKPIEPEQVAQFDSVVERPATAASNPPIRYQWVVAVAVAVVVAASIGIYLARRRAAHQTIRSLVVLPFQNFSQDGKDEYLADGLTEELTNELASWQDLRVVSRTSAFQYKGRSVDVRKIGQELNVAAVIEGSLSKQGDRLRVTAQLNRTSDGYHLWSQAYDTQSHDMIAVQEQIAHSISETVRKVGGDVPEQSARVSTGNAEAHDLYLQASYQYGLFTPDSLKKSLALFQKAIAKDNSYAAAYRGVATAENALIQLTAEAPRDGMDRVLQALNRTLELNPHDGEAHGLLAYTYWNWNWDWPRAEREYRIAMAEGAQARTHSAYGSVLATRGQFAEAHEQLRIAQDLDPLSFGPRFAEMFAYFFERRLPEARKMLLGIQQGQPDNLPACMLLGEIALVDRDCEGAAKQWESCARKTTMPFTKIGLALGSGCRGQREKSLHYLREATAGPAFVSPYQIALVYAVLGDKNRAIESLEKCAAAREVQIHYLKYEPLFDEIRSDPRYVALEKRVGLEP